MSLDTTTFTTVREEANDLLSATVELRRTLHEWPEVGNELPVTRDHVLEAIEGLPLDVTPHETTSGITALLTGTKPGPTILLRGDMDALPMHEDTGLDFASNVDGAMHACGHDTHTAMLVECGAPAGRPPGRPGRPSPVHVPAGRGGAPRSPVHARRGPARRPAAGRRDHLARDGGVRHPHHVVVAVGVDEQPRRLDHGVRRHDEDHRHRQGRPRQRATPGGRSDPRRLRGRAGAAADGDAHRRRVRPVGGDGRPDHSRHDEQRHPGDGDDPRHDPRRQREDEVEGARRHPPRGRRCRRGTRLRCGRRHRPRVSR